MMPTIFDVSLPLRLKDRRILVDTNIWLLLEGPSYGSYDEKQDLYSHAYKTLKDGNILLITQYVISEFCNRFLKIEFDNRQQADGKEKYPTLKRFKSTQEGREVLESARDTCLNFMDDCEYVEVSCGRERAIESLHAFGSGMLDFTDAILRSHAQLSGYTIFTDDRDYEGCGVDLITANRRLIGGKRQ